MKNLLITILSIILVGCESTSSKTGIDNKFNSFSTELRPSFIEPARICIKKENEELIANIVIYDNPRYYADRYNDGFLPDTFYSKEVLLTNSQFQFLYSDVIEKLQKGIKIDSSRGLDGITVNYYLSNEGDSVTYSIWSPNRPEASFFITKSLLENTDIIFKDSVISNYYDDVRRYLNIYKESEKGERPIDKIRKKYIYQQRAKKMPG